METVTILSGSLRERRVSVDIDTLEVGRRADEFGFRADESILVPISVLPKGLIFDFDSRSSSGESISLANRSVDSEISAALMAGHRDASAPACIDQILFAVAHAFPSDEFSTALSQPSGRMVLEALSNNFGIQIDAEGFHWWGSAWELPDFRRDLNAYAHNFLSMVRIDPGVTSQIFKFRRLEQASDSSKTVGEGGVSKKGDFSLVAYDVGRAASDHLRVIAPPGTFFTDALFLRLSPGLLAYSERTATDRLAFYTHGVDPGLHVVYAKLWPQRGGFMRPAKYLSGYGACVLILGAIAEWWTADRWGHSRGFLWHLGDMSDTATTLVLILPTILIAYIVREGEHDIRSKLLSKWRVFALSSLLPLWCAAISLLIERINLLPWSLLATWGFLGIVALILHLAIDLQDFRLARAYKRLALASPQTRDRTITTLPRA